MNRVTPPEGWHPFGKHVDQPGVKLEFSTETGEDGLPLWERVTPPESSEVTCPPG